MIEWLLQGYCSVANKRDEFAPKVTQFSQPRRRKSDVRFGSKADMCGATRDVRYGPKVDIACTHSSSLVSATEIALIAGAANTTTGNIAIHATNQDESQWEKTAPDSAMGNLRFQRRSSLLALLE